MDIKTFEADHITDAARLLAERGKRQRVQVPILPRYMEDIDRCASAIATAMEDGATGVAAFEAGHLTGYLIALRGDGVRGFHAWSTPECNAVSDDPEVIRHLYAAVAETWVKDGRGHHYAQVPSDDSAQVDAWLRLAFGHEQAHAVRAVSPAPTGKSDLVRRAGPGDIDLLEPTFAYIADAHQGPPTFTYIERTFRDELRPGHLELLGDPSVGYFLVEENGKALGFAAFRGVPADEASWYMPEGSVYLMVAAVDPSARGRGLMRALLAEGFEWAAKGGYELSVTDWRVTNLDSSKAWPALGYITVEYRLHRILDPRIFSVRD